MLAPEAGLRAVLFTNLVIGGLGAYALGREVGASPIGAGAGALAFVLGSAAYALTTWMPTVQAPYVWMPAAMLCCERLLKAPSLPVALLLGVCTGGRTVTRPSPIRTVHLPVGRAAPPVGPLRRRGAPSLLARARGRRPGGDGDAPPHCRAVSALARGHRRIGPAHDAASQRDRAARSGTLASIAPLITMHSRPRPVQPRTGLLRGRRRPLAPDAARGAVLRVRGRVLFRASRFL